MQKKDTSKIGPLKSGSKYEDPKKMANIISEQIPISLPLTKRRSTCIITTLTKWKQSFRNHNFRQKYKRGNR